MPTPSKAKRDSGKLTKGVSTASMYEFGFRSFGALPSLSKSEKRIREGWTWSRTLASEFVDNRDFDILVSLLVTFNVILVVVDTDIRAKNVPSPLWMQVTEKCLLAFYTMECALRMYAHRSKFFSRPDNIFDLAIVVIDLICIVLTPFVGDLPSVVFLRILRVGRALRFVRAIRTITFFRELYMMLTAFFVSMKAILWATILLFFVLMLWSVLAVETIHPLNQKLVERQRYTGCDRCGRAFESVAQAMLTFTQQIVLGDDWSGVIIPIIEEWPSTSIIFIAVLVTVQLGLMNLILAVIVDNAAQEHKLDEKLAVQAKEMHFHRVKDKLTELCKELDEDESGTLTLEELMRAIENVPEFADICSSIDLSKKDIQVMFAVLDDDGNGHVYYHELVGLLHKMKTSDNELLRMLIQYTHQELTQILSEKSLETEICVQMADIKACIKEQDGAIAELLSLFKSGMSNLNEQASPQLDRVSPATVADARDAAAPNTQRCGTFAMQARDMATSLNLQVERQGTNEVHQYAFEEELEQLRRHVNDFSASMQKMVDSGRLQSSARYDKYTTGQLSQRSLGSERTKRRDPGRPEHDNDDFISKLKCCAHASRNEDFTPPQAPTCEDMIVIPGRDTPDKSGYS